MTFEALQEVDAKHAASPLRVSSGNRAGVLSGKVSDPIMDPYQAKRCAPLLWAHWCRANYRTSAALAHAFNVDDRTARNWRNGRNEPGISVLLAVMPGAREFLKGGEI